MGNLLKLNISSLSGSSPPLRPELDARRADLLGALRLQRRRKRRRQPDVHDGRDGRQPELRLRRPQAAESRYGEKRKLHYSKHGLRVSRRKLEPRQRAGGVPQRPPRQ